MNNLILAKYIKIIDLVKRLIGLCLGIYFLSEVLKARGNQTNGVYENDCWATYGDIIPRKKIPNPKNYNNTELTKDGINFYLDDKSA